MLALTLDLTCVSATKGWLSAEGLLFASPSTPPCGWPSFSRIWVCIRSVCASEVRAARKCLSRRFLAARPPPPPSQRNSASTPRARRDQASAKSRLAISSSLLLLDLALVFELLVVLAVCCDSNSSSSSGCGHRCCGAKQLIERSANSSTGATQALRCAACHSVTTRARSASSFSR